MALLRVLFFEFAMCVNVVGAAVLFRRLFPRESPWFCFVFPILILLSALDFIEHFVALTNLGWLLPFLIGGLVWTMVKPGFSWEGLRFPTVLFLILFSVIFGLRSTAPEITNISEAISDLVRVLNYSLGTTLPQIDSFLPTCHDDTYYSFQHYAASIVKRLFAVDLGTAYNISYAFLLSWLCLTGAGVAHSISGKKWIAVAMAIILLGAWTGSCALLLLTEHGFDYDLSTSLNDGWDDPKNPFFWLCAHDQTHPRILLQPPMVNFYWSEYHATLGGNFITMAAMLAVSEAFKIERTSWCWIGLIVLPLVAFVSSSWSFIAVVFFCAGGLALALLTGRRPDNPKFVSIGSALGMVLLWPLVYSGTGMLTPVDFHWTTPEDHTPVWMFLVQWWPVFLPWLFLCCVWNRLDLHARLFLVGLPILFLSAEFITIGDRKITTEKLWPEIYGIGVVTLVPVMFMRKGIPFRFLSLIFLVVSPICLVKAIHDFYPNPVGDPDLANLSGDNWLQKDTQKKRLIQVLQRLHGATILPGICYWNYSQSPAVVTFSENRCFVAYTYHEFLYGRGAEGDYRSKVNNEFYAGTIADPLSFLRGYNIDAVMIWPEDQISDQLLHQFQTQLHPDFFYIDCKMDGPDNAGVFIRQSDLETLAGGLGSPPPVGRSSTQN
jgi:hypothetical protein